MPTTQQTPIQLGWLNLFANSIMYTATNSTQLLSLPMILADLMSMVSWWRRNGSQRMKYSAAIVHWATIKVIVVMMLTAKYEYEMYSNAT